MRYRLQPWQLALVVVLVCTSAVGFLYWRRASRSFSAADLIQYLPSDQAALVYIDTASLRSSGVLQTLAGSKAAEEPDYRRFVEQTGFDYRTDLDAVAAAFLRGDVYFVLRGRFDGKRLNAYAQAEGGACRNGVCNLPGSSPERHISFYLVKSGILALAVAKQDNGTDAIAFHKWAEPPRLPGEPVWISVPSYMFADSGSLPEGTHALLSPLAQTLQVTFAVGPSDQRLQVRLEVTCTTPAAAAALAVQLNKTTDLLKRMMAREHVAPKPGDLSGVLAAGNFHDVDRRVVGTWPIEQSFLEALADGDIRR